MKFRIAFLGVILTFTSVSISAGLPDGIYATVELGTGDIDTDAGYFYEEDLGHEYSVATINFAVGKQFSSNILAEGGLVLTTSDSFFGTFDELRNRHLYGALGYKLQLGKTISIVPKLGYGPWHATIKEGMFLNPGDEEEFDQSGEDIFASIAVTYQFRKRFGFSLSYSSADYDFGKYDSFNVGLVFTPR